MTQVNFYHLTKVPLGKALPRLLEKVLDNNMRAVVIADGDAMLEQLNKELWTFSTKIFIPHGTKKDGFEADQPVYLTSADNDNPNGANVLALVGKSDSEHIAAFDKCLYMFDGNNADDVAHARSRWKHYKEQGFELTYWQQNKKGAWEQGNG